MLPNFLVKTTASQHDCLSLNNSLAIRQFHALRSYLIDGAGREVAALFAEPVVTQKAEDLEIAWYAEPDGQPVAIEALDADVRRLVVDKLVERLRTIGPLLTGEMGALLARALYVADDGAILAVGHDPVLIKWGMVGHGVAQNDQKSLSNHFAATVGRYTTLPAPAIVRRTYSIPPSAVVVHAPDLAPQPGRAPLLWRRHPRLVTAVGLAALAALVLAVPGVIVRPKASPDPGVISIADARTITRAMQEKVANARAALKAKKCDTVGDVGGGGRDAELFPERKGSIELVARRATESVVMVLTCLEREQWDARHKSDKVASKPLACPEFGEQRHASEPSHPLVAYGSGSGFFIAARTIVTNLHVVDGAARVYVIGRGIPRAMRATVKVTTAPKTSIDAPDFAVLDLDIQTSPPPIELAPSASLLQDVVSAGFPGVMLDKDPKVEALLKGDATAVPDPTTYPGAVTLIKGLDAAMPLIFSSAVIGHGNSGGPLMNLCGEAVGMNTLGWSGTEEDTGYKVNVAEGAKALATFLDDNRIKHATPKRRCTSGAQAALDVPPAMPLVPPSAK